MMGTARPTDIGAFPLLVKFLDARESLSVQVHPSPAYAAAHKDAHLKTESWYILAAEARHSHLQRREAGGHSRSVRGTHQGQHCRERHDRHPRGRWRDSQPAQRHLSRARQGVLVAEIQTPSDTTFRVFDWGRVGRELHIEQALACIDFGPAPKGASLGHGRLRQRLVTTDFYTIEEARTNAANVCT